MMESPGLADPPIRPFAPFPTSQFRCLTCPISNPCQQDGPRRRVTMRVFVIDPAHCRRPPGKTRPRSGVTASRPRSCLMRRRNMDVLCACDERYVPHTATMLCSLLEANAGTRIHLLHSAAAGNEILKLKTFVE